MFQIFYESTQFCRILQWKKSKPKLHAHTMINITILLVQNNLPYKINEISVSKKNGVSSQKFEILYEINPKLPAGS